MPERCWGVFEFVVVVVVNVDEGRGGRCGGIAGVPGEEEEKDGIALRPSGK